MKLWRFAAPVLILLPTLPALCQQQEPVSLGEVARENKPTKKAKRVITDDDMPQRTVEDSAPSASSSGGGDASAPAANTASASSPTASAPAADSKSNAAAPAKASATTPEAEALRARIKEVVSDQLGLENVIRDTEAKIETEDDPNRRDTLKDILKNSKASLARRKAEAADLQSRLSALEKK